MISALQHSNETDVLVDEKKQRDRSPKDAVSAEELIVLCNETEEVPNHKDNCTIERKSYHDEQAADGSFGTREKANLQML